MLGPPRPHRNAYHRGTPSLEEVAVPPRRRAADPAALTDDDLADLRRRVAGGETPRVIVRAASAAVAAGTRGNVIRFGDPKDNEYVVVRLGRDEVPFAPSELALGRSPGGKKASPSSPAKAAVAPAPESRRSRGSRAKATGTRSSGA